MVGPLLVVLLYTLLIQSPRYESRSLLVVEKDQTFPSAASLDLGVLGLGLGSDNVDALLVVEFIRSQQLFRELDQRHQLVEHWQDRALDWLSRLPAAASFEDQYDYYLSTIDVRMDAESRILTVAVQAYDNRFAQVILRDIVKSSESFINGISQDLASSQVRFVEGELERAYRRLMDASDAMLVLQQQADVLSPEAEAQASIEILSGLQARRAAIETELRALTLYLNDDAPDVVALRRQLQAVRSQIEELRANQTGDATGGGGMNRMLRDFKEAELTAELAGDMYKVGLQTLETTRLEASRKAKFLVQIDPPSLPEDPRYPDVLRQILFTVLGLNVLYFLASLAWSAIREHSE
ncbi:MAG: hypothetical protein ABF296_01640 [Oceanococcaceae bacterium]